jgi:cell division protein FtsW (lipid II flippase)
MLLTISFVILTRISYEKSIKQFKIVAVSLIIGLFVPYLVKKLRFLKYLTWIYGAVGVFALAIVAVLGATTNGSNLSYAVNGITFQPSEFVKIIFVFFVAGMLKQSTSFGQVAISAAAAAVHVFILVLSKDLGSALLFFIAYVAMLFVATKNYFYLFSCILGGSAAAYVAYRLFPHVQVRVTAWLDPWNNINSSGYQVTQSLFAIGTGGWYGMGLYQGDPTSIPYVEKDSIFSAIAEEMGILFALCLILVCLSCFITFMQIAMRLKGDFYRYIAVGLATIYISQVFLTIGGGTRFIPLTGVTLPLVSYGGSSVLSTIIMFCIIQGLYGIKQEEGTRHARKERTADDE